MSIVINCVKSAFFHCFVDMGSCLMNGERVVGIPQDSQHSEKVKMDQDLKLEKAVSIVCHREKAK